MRHARHSHPTLVFQKTQCISLAIIAQKAIFLYRRFRQVRIYAVKGFERFRRKERISKKTLVEAIDQAMSGLMDADLGGGLVKQRVARPGQGKRGGYRTIIAYQAGKRAVFLFGFAKNARDNIAPDDLALWRLIGADLLAATEKAIEAAIADGELTEVHDE